MTDPHRPQFHFMPVKNWMNDPNGLIQWQGSYHLFYQYNPGGADHVNMHWGHAVSSDLVHWEHLPIALAPTPGGADKDGVFSGCAVDNDGVPTIIYTGVWPEVQCLAMGSPDLVHWTKYDGNPVITAPPDVELTCFRDPCVWREGGEWHMVIGSGFKGVGGSILYYRSKDLYDWAYQGAILTDDSGLTEQVWECPSFFRLDDKFVLIISITKRFEVDYLIGTFDGRAFVPEVRHRLDCGHSFYAPQTFQNEQGQRLMFGWINEGRTVEANISAGWAGLQSLPRVLTLRDDGYLGIEPAAEVEQLRGAHEAFADVELSPDRSFALDIPSDQWELLVEVEAGDASFGIRLGADGAEQTRIVYNPQAAELLVDRSQSSLNPDVQHKTERGTLELAPGEPLRLRVFLDHSALEIFANGRFCLTTRIYPTRNDSHGVSLFAAGGLVIVRSLDVWQINSI